MNIIFPTFYLISNLIVASLCNQALHDQLVWMLPILLQVAVQIALQTRIHTSHTSQGAV